MPEGMEGKNAFDTSTERFDTWKISKKKSIRHPTVVQQKQCAGVGYSGSRRHPPTWVSVIDEPMIDSPSQKYAIIPRCLVCAYPHGRFGYGSLEFSILFFTFFFRLCWMHVPSAATLPRAPQLVGKLAVKTILHSNDIAYRSIEGVEINSIRCSLWDIYQKGPKISHPRRRTIRAILAGNVMAVSSSTLYVFCLQR